MSGNRDHAHWALLYSTDREFLDVAAPYLRHGLAAGERVLALTTERNTALLRDALGADADLVDFADPRDWFQVPAWTMTRNLRYVERHGATHAGVRALGELGETAWAPVLSGQAREWARYEALVNLAPVRAPAWLTCAYDTRRVETELLGQVERTHPGLVTVDGVRKSPGYVDPATFVAELGSDELSGPPAWGEEQPVTPHDLSAIRALVRSLAGNLGLPSQRVQDAVVAINEVANNAVQHGRGRGRLRLWSQADELVCEVIDQGEPIRDPSPGWFPPDTEQGCGRGLWIARQLCEFLDVRSGTHGNTVRLHVGI